MYDVCISVLRRITNDISNFVQIVTSIIEVGMLQKLDLA